MASSTRSHWRTLSLAAVCLLLTVTACSKAAGPEDAGVRVFLNRYFSTWSAKDMDGYGGCFHPQARITFVGMGGGSQSDGLTDFLHGQKLSHAQSPVPMAEVPTDMKITADGRVAQAAVRWKLTKGTEVVTGTDYFTLIQTESGWRIMSLVFYND